MRIRAPLRTLSISLLMLSLSACYTTPNTTPPPDITKHIALTPFHEVRVDMAIPVTLRQSQNPEVWITGPERLTRRVVVQQNDDSVGLFSRGDEQELSKLQVVLCSPNFESIWQLGDKPILGDQVLMNDGKIISTNKGSIKISGIKSNHLDIINRRNGSIALEGDINLQSIKQEGKGHIAVYWVHSDKVDVQATGHGMISLAGTTKNLNALLRNKATLDAKYLRSGRSYVNAEEHAIAHITTVDSQNLLANQHGKIYYYKDTKHKAHYASTYGEILRTVGIGSHTS